MGLQHAGLPLVVLSVCQGYGLEAGTPLVEDDRVGLVSFTGSVPTGKRIQQAVSARPVLAKVCLELGGKNPLVVCDDADLAKAAEHAVASAFIDAGHTISNRGSSFGESQGDTLVGTGVGVEFLYKRNLSLRLDWGVALEGVPATAGGGSAVRAGGNRLHFVATCWY